MVVQQVAPGHQIIEGSIIHLICFVEAGGVALGTLNQHNVRGKINAFWQKGAKGEPCGLPVAIGDDQGFKALKNTAEEWAELFKTKAAGFEGVPEAVVTNLVQIWEGRSFLQVSFSEMVRREPEPGQEDEGHLVICDLLWLGRPGDKEEASTTKTGRVGSWTCTEEAADLFVRVWSGLVRRARDWTKKVQAGICHYFEGQSLMGEKKESLGLAEPRA